MRPVWIPLLVLFLTGTPFLAAEEVRHVIDGDTLVLDTHQRVRLIGVDAPEVDHPRYNRIGEPFGNEARDYLKQRIEGREVRLESGPEPFDKYGRRLAYVWDGEVLVNALLIEKGYAEAMRTFPHPRMEMFLELEQAARQIHAGLWSGKPAPRSGTGAAGSLWAWFFLALAALIPFLKKRR